MGAPARCELMLKRQPQSFGRIFEPFFKRHHHGRGAGLGLNLVRDILRMHGGEVTIDNRNPGAVCRLSFPPDKTAGVHTPPRLATA
uniref:histidine kinase n=1 Tax=Rhizobium leguminosarum bv. trifolii TaxID=386 RepID=A0A1C9I4F6_RHILT|nr:sensor histidine kinase [Rhizobium leguminosarum bv. trifolii]